MQLLKLLVEEMGFDREAIQKRVPELRGVVEPISMLPESAALRAEYQSVEKSLQVRVCVRMDRSRRHALGA